VRSYGEKDLGGIHSLLDGLLSPTGREYDARAMIGERRKDEIYVAAIEGQIVGFAIGVFNSWNKTAYLDLVGVDHHRQGIGTELMSAVVQSARAKGARLIYTETAEANAAALCFYIRNGFAPAGVIPDYYRQGEDAIILVRKLFHGGVGPVP